MNGKGSTRRPTQISRSQFEQNWDRIFGKKDKKEDKNTKLDKKGA